MENKKNILSWDEYFMNLAYLSALRSKDPNTQVGACIVDRNNKVVSVGYNGMPTGLDESKLSWNKGEGLDSKYLYVCHAELNAILNVKSGISLKDCVLYVSLFPCNECAKAIIQSGITEIVYNCDKYKDLTGFIASRKMLELAGIKLREYKGRLVEFKI